MFDWIADPNVWVALATLTALDIVLGIGVHIPTDTSKSG